MTSVFVDRCKSAFGTGHLVAGKAIFAQWFEETGTDMEDDFELFLKLKSFIVNKVYDRLSMVCRWLERKRINCSVKRNVSSSARKRSSLTCRPRDVILLLWAYKRTYGCASRATCEIVSMTGRVSKMYIFGSVSFLMTFLLSILSHKPIRRNDYYCSPL